MTQCLSVCACAIVHVNPGSPPISQTVTMSELVPLCLFSNAGYLKPEVVRGVQIAESCRESLSYEENGTFFVL